MKKIDEFKKSVKEYEKWESSLEGILSNLRSNEYDQAERENKLIIAKTLQKLPKNIRDKVLSEILFLHVLGYGTIMKLYFPIPPKTKKIEQYCIILNFSLMKKEDQTESDMMDTVAHEVAHFILGQYSGSMDASPKDERHADDLTEKWGFKRSYKEPDYEKFEKGSPK